ncbi:MAG: hypothetical protein AVDCRST_MAG56-4457, partial [uncultured Cytophagales bacterium]
CLKHLRRFCLKMPQIWCNAPITGMQNTSPMLTRITSSCPSGTGPYRHFSVC